MTKRTFAVVALLAVGFLIAGFALGIVVNGLPGSDEPQESHAAHADDHIPLTKEAFRNLGIELGSIQLSDHFRVLRIPAEVIEMPGHSDHGLVAPVTGVVTQVHAAPGQTVRAGDRLFELRVTDESFSAAQISLLEAITRAEVVDAEIKRLTPLVESGAVAGSRTLKLEYERKQLLARRDSRFQELKLYGLTQADIDSIIGNGELIRGITVSLPEDFTAPAPAAAPTDELDDGTAASPPASDGLEFTVEVINVSPGNAVNRGDELCQLAYHTLLYIKGEAFETEVETLTTLNERGWLLTAEFGLHGDELTRGNLKIQYVDNHVDTKTQTFRFYVPLRNEVVKETTDERGLVYRSWRFKPGQRAHLLVPVEKLKEQIKLPLGAVAQQGADAFVFRVFTHKDEPDANGHAHAQGGHEHGPPPFIEFSPVSVHVLHQDTHHAVVSRKGDLKPGDVIAMRSAYQLHLATKVGGGGHAGHGHPH